MARLITAQPKFKILVANIEGAGDPSRGINPVKVRTGFEKQNFPEIARGDTAGRVGDPSTPGLGTLQGLLDYTTPPVPVAVTGTVVVADGDFTAAATLFLGDYTLVSDEDYTAGSATQATGFLTVVATPSVADITIGAGTLTAAAGARTPGGDDYDGTLGTPALIAADIIAAINDPANGFTAIATAATGGGAIVNLTAVPVGAAGNALALATTDAGDVTVSGATFTGGVDATDTTAVALAAAISALPDFSAVVLGDTVTITGPFGPNGNDIRFAALYTGVVQNFTLTPSDGFFAGGEPTIGPPTIL